MKKQAKYQQTLEELGTINNNEYTEDLLVPHGDKIEEKQRNIIRLGFQNINGIKGPLDQTLEILEEMGSKNIDILGTAETNINWTHKSKIKLQLAMKLRFGQGITVTSASPSTKEGYQPGGTLLAVKGQTLGRITSKGSDAMGRFSWVRMQGKANTSVLIITAYRVCKMGPNPGPFTAYSQQMKMLFNAGHLRPNPRKQILTDLSEMIQKQHMDGGAVIVMMDANEDIAASNDGELESFVIHNQLVDVHKTINATVPITTYSRGRQRLDYIFITAQSINAVQKAGYMSLFDGVISDHRMCFIDVDTSALFGSQRNNISLPQQREFACNDRVTCIKVNKAIEKYIHEHNISGRVSALAKDLRSMGPTEQLVETFNQLDSELTRSIKSAMNKHGKKNVGYHASPTLTEAGRRVLTWRAILSSKRRCVPYSNALHDRMANMSLDPQLVSQMTMAQIIAEVRTARAHQRQCQKESKELRIQWIKERARRQAAATGEADPQKVLKAMMRTLHMKAVNAKLSEITKGKRNSLHHIDIPTNEWYYSKSQKELYHYDSGVFEAYPNHTTDEHLFKTHHVIKVPPPDSVEVSVKKHIDVIQITKHTEQKMQWQHVDTKLDMEKHLLARNKRHLQQVAKEDGTPYKPWFQEMIQGDGYTQAGENILNGEPQTGNVKLTPEMSAWLGAIMQTETEKSLPTIEGRITTEEFQQAFKSAKEKTSSSPSGLHYTIWKCIATDLKLSETFATMMSLPFMYGFVNKRWTKSTDVMLEKKKDTRQIHQLRIIGLLEADFNTALKLIFSKKMMKNAEQAGITSEQWGGRNNRTAIDVLARKTLTVDYSHLTHNTLAIFANDATACFDRMVPGISSLIARKYGVSPTIMQSRNQTIHQMRHNVRTGCGESEETYANCSQDTHPMSGEVQGKGDVPSLWCLLSHTLLTAHNELHDPIILKDATGTILSKKNNDAFFDDTDCYAMTTPIESQEATKTTQILQNKAQSWNALVASTGGAIAHHKCKWSIIHWDLSGIIPKLKPTTTHTIQLTDSEGCNTTIPQITPDQPNIGLGFRLALNGTQIHEYNYRLQQCKQLHGQITRAHLTKEEAYLMLLTRVIPKVTYPMAFTQFTQQECKRLNTVIDTAMLPKIGLNQHMPKAVVYGPLHLGGINYPKFETIQVVASITYLVKQLRWNKDMAKDILIILSTTQLVAGLCRPILEDTDSALPHVPCGWIMAIRARLRNIDAKIWIEEAWYPRCQREHDEPIMKAFLQIKKATPTQLKAANQCRIYAKVITIADLAGIDGHYIPQGRTNGRWQAKSTLTWPEIPCPNKEAWRIFRSLLRKTFCTKQKKRLPDAAMKLDQPLGIWNLDNHHIRYEYYRTEKQGYDATGDHITRYTVIPSHPTHFSHPEQVKKIPKNAHPVCATTTQTSMRIRRGFQGQITQRKSKISIDQPITLDMECKGNPIINSDGSAHIDTKRGSCAWIIRTEKGHYGGSTALPPMQSTSSYRPELEGMYRGTKQYIEAGCDSPPHYYCDNSSVLKQCETPVYSTKQMLAPEADIILALKSVWQERSWNPSLSHVKSHQDNDKPFSKLSQAAKYNVLCDEMAGKAIHQKPESLLPYKGSKAMVKIKDQWITDNITKRVTEAANSKATIDYIIGKFNWTDEQFQCVKWTAIGEARQGMTKIANTQISKLMYGWLNVGSQKQHMKQVGACPCCGMEKETVLHLYQCPHTEMRQAREEAIGVIEEQLFKEKIPPIVATAFVEVIKATIQSDEPALTGKTCKEIADAITQQQAIGLPLFLRGFITIGWRTAITKFTKERIGRKLVSLIKMLWSTLFTNIWTRRNAILHGSTSMNTKLEEESIEQQLLIFRDKRNEWLHYTMYHLVDYDDDKVKRWHLHAKKETLQLLEAAKKCYLQTTTHDPTQTKITDYWKGINNQ